LFGRLLCRNSSENGSTVEARRLNAIWSLAISLPASGSCYSIFRSALGMHFAGFTGDCHLFPSAI
jgi:hypothetical protein